MANDKGLINDGGSSCLRFASRVSVGLTRVNRDGSPLISGAFRCGADGLVLDADDEAGALAWL